MVKQQKSLCDGNCNDCPIILHKNSRMLTFILNKSHGVYPEAYNIVQSNCPNLTVCYDCRIDDFVHEEGCVLKDNKNIEDE